MLVVYWPSRRYYIIDGVIVKWKEPKKAHQLHFIFIYSPCVLIFSDNSIFIYICTNKRRYIWVTCCCKVKHTHTNNTWPCNSNNRNGILSSWPCNANNRKDILGLEWLEFYLFWGIQNIAVIEDFGSSTIKNYTIISSVSLFMFEMQVVWQQIILNTTFSLRKVRSEWTYSK